MVTRGHATVPRGDMLARRHGGKGRNATQRETGLSAGGIGRAWLSEPAVKSFVIRTSVRERTARRAVPTLGPNGISGLRVREQARDLNFTWHPNLDLNTRARDLRAETWYLKMSPTFAPTAGDLTGGRGCGTFVGVSLRMRIHYPSRFSSR